ncbi:hypothetical protein RCH10_005332 [Variovorax sp. GrIS 2.14]
MDETYIKVSGEWKYLYRAVDRAGHTIDFLLRAHRDVAAARCFFERAIDLHGVPEKITIDKSGANTAAILDMCADSGADIEMRQSKYLNNLIEQDHRAIKRIVRPMLGFKSLRCARALIAGIETMHMIKKGQLDVSTRQTHIDAPAPKVFSPAATQFVTGGTQQCGSNSSMRLIGCVGSRVKTSFRYAYGSCPLSRADWIRLMIAAAL